MRCRNCGWNNPDGATECEKCHSKLTGFKSPNRPQAARPGDSRSLGQTPTVMGRPGMPGLQPPKPATPFTPGGKGSAIGGSGSSSANLKHRPGICPDCGYPVSEKAESCPNCGYDFSKFAKANDKKGTPGEAKPAFNGTILTKNPFANFDTLDGRFSLQPVDENGNPYDEPMIFNEGDTLVFGNERFVFSVLGK